MNKKAKKELKEKEIYVRFEKLAKRLRKERKELDANEFWKFLILELDQAITKARKELLSELYRAGRTSFAGGFKDDPQKVFDNLQEKYYQSLTKEK